MPKFPGPVSHNDPSAPILKLGENQVKGMGVFADLAARTALPESLRSVGYVAVVVDVNKTFIYSGADLTGWGTTTNWKIQGDEAFTHTQGEAADTWTVTHNLNRYPSVTVVDNSGVPLEGFELAYTNTNVLTLKFYIAGALSAVDGQAFIN